MKKVIPLAILALILIPAYIVAAKSDTVSATKPSIVLVHGAWADGSSWSRVIALLQDQGYTVYAPANPLRGLASDSAYIARLSPHHNRTHRPCRTLVWRCSHHKRGNRQ